MSDFEFIVAVFASVSILANIAILSLNLKLYTEIFKARDQRR